MLLLREERELPVYYPSVRSKLDTSVCELRFQVVLSGSTTSVAGTSASSPAFAGVISLLNDYRISQGKPALGFLNPWLYSNAASALNDITSGSNPGCGTNGFTARAGWVSLLWVPYVIGSALK